MSETAKQPLGEIMGLTMEKIREMVDVNTIIGEAINAPDGTTIIPVSKVTFGVASGGSSFGNKPQTPPAPQNFGGGGGAGVTITPVAFLVIANGNVRMLSIGAAPSNTVDRLVEKVPEILDKVQDFFSKQKKEDASAVIKAE